MDREERDQMVRHLQTTEIKQLYINRFNLYCCSHCNNNKAKGLTLKYWPVIHCLVKNEQPQPGIEPQPHLPKNLLNLDFMTSFKYLLNFFLFKCHSIECSMNLLIQSLSGFLITCSQPSDSLYHEMHLEQENLQKFVNKCFTILKKIC